MAARLGVATILALAFVWRGLFLGEAPLFRDFLLLVIPLRTYAARALASGEVPLWTPDLFFGAPFLANYQSAVLYPPSLILSIVREPIGLSLFLGVHLAGACIGMTRYLERRESCGSWAALFGGVVYAAGGYFASLMPLTNHLTAAAWVPWILLAATRHMAAPSGRSFAALAVLLAMQLLTGAPETVSLTWVILALVVAREVRHGDGRGEAIASVAAAVALAIALSAMQLLPTAEYARQTGRAEGLAFAAIAAESFEPRSLQQFVLPHTFSDGAPDLTPEGGVPLFWSFYVSVAPLALAFAAGSRPFWLAIGVMGLALALGEHSPFFRAAHAMAPSLVGLFRYPAKLFLAVHIAMSILAAVGLERSLASQERSRGAIVVGILLIAAAIGLSATAARFPSATLAALGFDLRPGLRPEVYVHLASGVALSALRTAGIALAMLLLLRWGHRSLGAARAAALLVVLTLVDLVAVHHPIPSYGDWASIADARLHADLGIGGGERVFHYCREGFGCLPEGAEGIGRWSGILRAMTPVVDQARELSRALVPDLPLLHSVGAVGGNDGFLTLEQTALWDVLAELPPAAGARVLGALGVSVLIGREPLPESLAPAAASLYVTRIEAAPRLYLATRVHQAANVRSALIELSKADFVLGRDVVLAAAMDTEPTPAPELVATTVDTTRIHASVRAEGGTILVVADSFYPGWTATIDGEETEILRANGIARAVRIPPGTHEIEMRYRPRSVGWGGAISAVAALGLTGIVLKSRAA